MEIGALGIYICLFLSLYFEVFLLITFLEHKREPKTSASPAYYPTVAIIVPCWNKAKTLRATVESLLALDYPKSRLSIIIIDDGSTDGTLRAAGRFAKNRQVHIFSKENEGSKFSALNFGIAHSESELVGCLDADSFVEPDALTEMVKHFEREPDTMAVTPVLKVYQPKNLLELMQAVEYTFGIFWRKMLDHLGAISVLPGPFSIYRREVFERIGTFRRAHHTEDMEIAFRMQERGLRIANAHTAHVHTKVPSALGDLLRQRTRWNRGYLENSRDYARLYFNPRLGNLGLLVLPYGLFMFVGGLYTALYLLSRTAISMLQKGSDLWATQIPLHVGAPHFEWFYINTSVLTFLVMITFLVTLLVVYIGQRIGSVRLPLHSFLPYVLLYGFVAPLWLARALWDTVLSRDRGWL